MTGESAMEIQALLDRLARGERDVLAALFEHYRPGLRKMVQLRLDPRLAARLDPSDVLQEAYLDANGQLDHYLRQPRAAFYVWLRGLAWERLLKLERQHLAADCRTVHREVHFSGDSSAQAVALAVAPDTPPVQALIREELRQRVEQALNRLSPEDREIILLRNFEGLSNNDVAELLGLGASGATMRHGRALVRFKEQLASVNEGQPGISG